MRSWGFESRLRVTQTYGSGCLCGNSRWGVMLGSTCSLSRGHGFQRKPGGGKQGGVEEELKGRAVRVREEGPHFAAQGTHFAAIKHTIQYHACALSVRWRVFFRRANEQTHTEHSQKTHKNTHMLLDLISERLGRVIYPALRPRCIKSAPQCMHSPNLLDDRRLARRTTLPNPLDRRATDWICARGIESTCFHQVAGR